MDHDHQLTRQKLLYQQIDTFKVIMDVPMILLFLILLFPVIVVPTSKEAAKNHPECPVSRCSRSGPVIRFPFRRRQDPLHCGHPDFEVSCSTFNKTVMKLSSTSGFFTIKNINYVSEEFSVYDADGCLPKRLLDFNLSSSLIYLLSDYSKPCRLIHDTYIFTLLNCSTKQNFSRSINNYMPIRCLSVPGHHQVLAFPYSSTIDDLPLDSSNCSTLDKDLYLPAQRVSDASHQCELSNVLLLKWKSVTYFQDVPACQNCTSNCQINNTRNQLECYKYSSHQNHPQERKGILRAKVTPVTSDTHVFAIGVAIGCCLLISVAVAAIFYFMRHPNRKEQKQNHLNIEKFLYDHKSHVPTRYSYADIKKMTNRFKRK